MSDSDSPPRQSQSVIRSTAKLARAELSDDERRAASREIATKMFEADFFRDANNIACFIPMPTEVDTWPIIKRAWKMKKRVFAPNMEENTTLTFRRLKKNSALLPRKMGIPELDSGEFIAATSLDLVLTPLVAFDQERNRIGMGAGYYDRTFSFLQGNERSLKPLLVGIAFECQQVEKITPNPWDIPLFRVFTESAER